jgi:fumarylacetoacetate (FAA) hydrolase
MGSWEGRCCARCAVKRLAASIPVVDTPFHYGDLITHVAQTRAFEPGTIVGLGTVSNEDESAGCGCIGEIRALETLRDGKASTPFFSFRERVRIEHVGHDGQSVFGYIDQRFVPATR